MYYDEPKNPLHIAQKQALADLIAQQTIDKITLDRFKEREGAFDSKEAVERLNAGPQLGNRFTDKEREENFTLLMIRELEQREKAELAKWEHEQKTLPATKDNFLLTMLTKEQLINYIKHLKGQV